MDVEWLNSYVEEDKRKRYCSKTNINTDANRSPDPIYITHLMCVFVGALFSLCYFFLSSVVLQLKESQFIQKCRRNLYNVFFLSLVCKHLQLWNVEVEQMS